MAKRTVGGAQLGRMLLTGKRSMAYMALSVQESFIRRSEERTGVVDVVGRKRVADERQNLAEIDKRMGLPPQGPMPAMAGQ